MFDENERHLYLNACIPIKVLSFKVGPGIERLVLVLTYTSHYGGIPIKELLHHKQLYQPGAGRKVGV